MNSIKNAKWLPDLNLVELSFDSLDADHDLICSVFGFIFNNENQLLMIKKDRGWDIPGGGRESGESPEQAVIREIQEEAMVRVTGLVRIATNKLTILSEMEPENYWRPFPVSYEFFFCCKIGPMADFVPNSETEARRFFDIEEAFEQEGIQFGNRTAILKSIKESKYYELYPI